ncbi:MAG: sigma-54 dependent transcriptional regulator [Bdellovibrionota bacterium]
MSKSKKDFKPTILVVDDELSIREFLQIMLKREKMLVDVACDGEEALKLLENKSYDLVISDIKMPKVDGLELLSRVKAMDPHALMLMITAHGSTELAVEAMKKGAYDFLTKPFKIDDVKLRIEKALDNRVLVQENSRMRKELGEKYSFANIVGSSPQMMQVFDLIKRTAATNANVLITGDSGTGKELVAKGVHYNSSVKDGPFLTLNCGAIPEDLIESELFGHKKGSFTGAISDKKGYFEAADGGTLFLDEIGELPLNLQATLLRVLSDGTFSPVGSTESKTAQVRIIAATNRDLEEEVHKEAFREDLYFRLNVIHVRVPSLRERKEDIPMLVNHFVEEFSERFGRQTQTLASETMELLKAYNWPGNVRELENVVERMIALESGPNLLPDSLPPNVREPLKARLETLQNQLVWKKSGVKLDEVLAQVEREFVLKALEEAKGVRRDAAKLLAVTMRSLRYRLEKLGLTSNAEDEVA